MEEEISGAQTTVVRDKRLIWGCSGRKAKLEEEGGD